MANELKHGSVGTELTQAEWEGIGTHVFESQATGDMVYASSSSQLRRLAKGTDTHVLILSSGVPAWSSSTGITAVGTIATGVWQGTTIEVNQGGTGATSLSNLIALTTMTTGNYVATVTGGTGITSSGATSGEGIGHSLSVDASQTQITAVGTIATGVWQGTDVEVAYGGTGVSTLADNAVLTGTGASAITAESNLTFDGSDLTVATDVGIIFSDSGQKIESDGTDLTIASGADLSLITTGVALFGSSTKITMGGLVDGGSSGAPELQIAKTGGISSLLLSTNNGGDGYSSTLAFLKSGSNTIGTPTTVVNNEDLGNIVWVAADGTDFNAVAARIFVEVDGAVEHVTDPAKHSVPGRITFLTTKVGDGTPSTRMQIKATGEIDFLSNALGITNVGGSGNDFDASGITVASSADSAAVADEVSFGRYEIGAGNTVIALSQETVVATETDETKFSHKMQVRLNGATYYMMLTAS